MSILVGSETLMQISVYLYTRVFLLHNSILLKQVLGKTKGCATEMTLTVGYKLWLKLGRWTKIIKVHLLQIIGTIYRSEKKIRYIVDEWRGQLCIQNVDLGTTSRVFNHPQNNYAMSYQAVEYILQFSTRTTTYSDVLNFTDGERT